ncbi:MAG: response regulator transcription factor [SAR202 cluster bacterium]|nr:response regulator transcription factor [SAR202 cluster bacterium]
MAKTMAKPAASGRSALLVCDSPELSTELIAVLSDNGYRVTQIDDIKLMPAHVGKGGHHVMVLTQPFEGMSWHRTIKAAKSMAPGCSVMVMASHVTEMDIRDALSAGSFISLSRPIASSDFATLVSQSKNGLFVALR